MPKRGLQKIGFVWACGTIMAGRPGSGELGRRGSGQLEQTLRDLIFNQNMKQRELEGR